MTYGSTEESPPTDARCALKCSCQAENGCSEEILKRDSNRTRNETPVQDRPKGMHSDEGSEGLGDKAKRCPGNGLLDHPSRLHRMDETASLGQCKSLTTLSRMSRQGIEDLPRKRGPDRRRLTAPLP